MWVFALSEILRLWASGLWSPLEFLVAEEDTAPMSVRGLVQGELFGTLPVRAGLNQTG